MGAVLAVVLGMGVASCTSQVSALPVGAGAPAWGLDWRTLYGRSPGWTSAVAKASGVRGIVLDASGLADSFAPSGRPLAGLGAFDARARAARCSLERRGFEVAAVLGAPGWAGSGQRPLVTAMAHHVADSASWRACPARLLFLDIEPYALRPAPSHQAALAELAGVVRAVARAVAPARLPLGVFLPAWATRTPAGRDVLAALRPGDVVGAMTYRLKARGQRGAVATDLAFARFVGRVAPSLRLLFGFEAGPVSEEGISFAGSTRTRLARAAGEVSRALRAVPQFDGLFVDDMASLQQLRN